MKKLIAAAAVAGSVLAVGGAASADNFGCPPVENAEWAVFNTMHVAPDLDRNGDGFVCGKLVPGTPGMSSGPFDNFVFIDNNV